MSSENIQYHDYSVLVRCYTYNQFSFISTALNGFANQKTSFQYVCLVVDDASTDGEQSVIQSFIEKECDLNQAEYYDIPEALIYIAPHKSNKNCTFAVYFLKQNLYKQKAKKTALVEPWRLHCKYEAMCEGDDYWTDPCKLQKQFDYMEMHPECGLLYTDYGVTSPDYNFSKSNCFGSGSHRSVDFKDHLLNRGYIAPMTWLYRIGLLSHINYPDYFIDGTFAMALEFFYHSEVHYIPDNTAEHVVHKNSACHKTGLSENFYYKYDVFKEQLFYADKYAAELIDIICLYQYPVLLPDAIAIQCTSFLCEAESFYKNIGFDYKEVEAKARTILELRMSFERVRESLSYKIGNCILRPIKFLRKKIKSVF